VLHVAEEREMKRWRDRRCTPYMLCTYVLGRRVDVKVLLHGGAEYHLGNEQGMSLGSISADGVDELWRTLLLLLLGGGSQ